MTKIRFAIPGIGGSLGMCAICGESFATEIILGKAVSSLKIVDVDRSLPVHDNCGDAVVALQGPWEQVRDRFPKGPMFDAFEEEYKASAGAAEGR